MIVALAVLAIADLVVGVSNDAVNFLNSAIGSKAVSFKTIMIVASLGVAFGALSSSGMMEVARKGIFMPSEFYFNEIMIIFMAVMITDILLLDFFNTLGMPTSTTVSIVFELLGAAVVIVGALFKIMHWPGANEMLILGMGTEAVIFMISAFEPIHEEWDWSLVHPELAGMEGDSKPKQAVGSGDAVSQQLDKMLSEAKIGPDLIEGLGSGLRSLSSNVSSMSDLSGATVATKEYADNITKANEQLTGMNSSYSRAVNALDSLSETTETFKETTLKVANINATLNDNLVSFDQNIQSLNKVYGGMLSAMRPNS